MAFTVDPQTGKISFGVVSDGTHDAISIDLASQFGVSEDFKDDFITDNWVETGTLMAVNTTTKVLDWDARRDSTSHVTVHDLGAGNVSDDDWVLRFKLTIDVLTLPVSGSNSNLYIGMRDTDETVVATSTSHDGMWLEAFISTSTTQFRFHDGTGVALNNTPDYTFTKSPTQGETVYIEMVKLTSTTAQLTIYSDSEYTSIIEQSTVSTVGFTGSRYLFVSNFNSGSSTGEINGSIDDVQFWNGITVPVITSTNWRLRYELDLTNIDDGASATDKTLFFGLGDLDGLNASSVLQDGYFLRAFTNTGPDAFHVITPDNEAPRTKVADVVMTTTPSVSTFFVEMVRDSMSQTTFNFYTDATYVTLLDTETQAGISGSDSLKYLKAFNDNVASASGAIDGSIDNITFTDLGGVSPTMDEAFTVNGILQAFNIEETFIVDALIKQLGVNGCGEAFFSDDFTGVDAWDDSGTGIAVNTTTDVIDWDFTRTNAHKATAFDLGAGSLNTTSWRLRFKCTVDNFSGIGLSATGGWIMIGDSDETVDSATVQNFIACFLRNDTVGSTQEIKMQSSDGTLMPQSGTFDFELTSTFVVATPMYFELERLTATTYQLTWYSDASFTTVVETSGVKTLTGTPSGLRYIKVLGFDFAVEASTFDGTIDDVVLNSGFPFLSCPTVEVDAVLLPPPSVDKTFTIDACLEEGISLNFTIDACVGFFAGRRSRIGDIIILCLRAFPASTGQEVVDHVNSFTLANGVSFRGKTSRVKNWLGFLLNNGFISEDGSDPDWYETKWTSLV